MVIPNLGDRVEIRRRLRSLFACVENREYRKAKVSSDRLRFSLIRYYNSKGVSANHFNDLFEKLNYMILYASDGLYKQDLLLEQLERLTEGIRALTKEGPVDQLKEFHDEIRILYMNINKENAAAIVDCFNEIMDLEAAFKKMGGPSYASFQSMVQCMGDAEPVLLQVAGLERIPTNLSLKLIEKFGNLFVAMMQIRFPPIKLNITKKQLIEALDAGVSMQDISYATGQTEAELLEILKSQDDGESEVGYQ